MNTNWSTEWLSELCITVWTELARAKNDSIHAWRTPGLATLDASKPQSRTVVLRGVDGSARQLVAFSDSRAAKVDQLLANPQAQWLFHDPVHRVQLRATTTVEIHHNDELAKTFWNTVPEPSRQNYRTLHPPGMKVTGADVGRETTAELDHAHFAVLAATVTELDWLWLTDRGHRRAGFHWQDGAWHGEWLVA